MNSKKGVLYFLTVQSHSGKLSTTPKIRVCSEIFYEHQYRRSLYDPIQDHVVDIFFPPRCWHDVNTATRFLKEVDHYHLHWPEHFLGTNLAAHQRMIDCLKAANIKIIWTQHNLVPHHPDKRKNAQEIYQAWASAADAVIHHSNSGKRRVLNRFEFNPQAIHRTIYHGHFGNLIPDYDAGDRRMAEQELDMTPSSLRIGIIGAPRIDKDTEMFMAAFSATNRRDIQLLVTCLRGDEKIPNDRRITALPYEFVDRELYNLRLRTIDILAFPIKNGESLTTGLVGDSIGSGIPGLISDWDFLSEILQDAALPLGNTPEEMSAAIETLNVIDVKEKSLCAKKLQSKYDWQVLAQSFLQLLRTLDSDPKFPGLQPINRISAIRSSG